MSQDRFSRPRGRLLGEPSTWRSAPEPSNEVSPRLPPYLKREPDWVRNWVLRRVAIANRYTWSPAGVGSPIKGPSQGFNQLKVPQRVIVRAVVSRHYGVGWRRYRALSQHLRYLIRDAAGLDGETPSFFDATRSGLPARGIARQWGDDRHHYRIVISPEHADYLADLRGYVREVMGRVAEDLAEPNLTWVSICHFNTEHPHAHVVVRGRREDGRDLIIPRQYLLTGIRARAQEVASEQLGDFSRRNEEHRIWRETKAEHPTALDRRLSAAVDEDELMSVPVDRGPAWRALIRARLRTLKALGLAEPVGSKFRLAADLQGRLAELHLSKAKLRVINQRQLETGKLVEELREGRLRGRVVDGGFHDQQKAAGYVIVRDDAGAERYVRLAIGQTPGEAGRVLDLHMTSRGAVQTAELQHGLQ